MEKPIELSLIVPAFKAGKFLKQALLEKQKVLDSLRIPYEIIIIADGYDPETDRVLKSLKKNKRIRSYLLPKNRGKGYAVKFGFKKAKGNIIAYMDADNDIDPQVIKDGYFRLIESESHAILPSKNHKDSQTNYPHDRKLFSRVYNFMVRRIFLLQCSDTQLGAKIYSKDLLEKVLPHCQINGFAFELEMLKIAQILGYNRFEEIPVKIDLKTKSTISFINGLSVIKDSLLLYPRILLLNAKFKQSQKENKKHNQR
jgi:glycosyltransferase involved in cell wall biosynthesis